MGIGVAEPRDTAVEATGDGVYIFDGDKAPVSADSDAGWHESPRHALGLRVTDDRVLIRADKEDHAPTQTEAGLYLATSLAAAVEGEDPGESWFVGTIVQLGPLVNHFDIRKCVLRWIGELEAEGHDILSAELRVLAERIEGLPKEQPDPLKVGDRVSFSWASGQQIAMDGEKYLILRASDVLAVLEAE